jgi:hypothetical protein
MTHKIRFSIVIGFGITLFILVLVVGSLALAQEDSGQGATVGEVQANPMQATPVPGGPGYVSLSSVAFTPNNSETLFKIIGQILYNQVGGYTSAFYAPISLPNGTTITKFVVFYKDDGTDNLTAWLRKGSFDSIAADIIAQAQSMEDDSNIHYAEDSTIDSPLVDQQSYSYYIQVLLPATLTDVIGLIAVRVDYTYPSQLPLIQK